MADDKQDKKEINPTKGLDSDDVALWQEMTKDVRRMEGREYVEPDTPLRSIEKPSSPPDVKAAPPELQKSNNVPRDRNLDRNTMRRLERGEMQIEGRLDLHGMNQEQARAALVDFIRGSEAVGKRCVLVVTGKGNTGRKTENWYDEKPGVLKRRVPDWLREKELASVVLQAVPAQRKDGGDGALYVYLRRRRDYN